MNREELAWAAGFFDGEGWVGAVKHGGLLSLRIGQVDRRPLDRFVAALGIGSVLGPYVQKTPHRQRPVFIYQIGGYPQVQAVGAMLWQWLSAPKREQFRAALSSVRDRLKPWRQQMATCTRGHPLSDVNLIRTTTPTGWKRVCRTCRDDYAELYYSRRDVKADRLARRVSEQRRRLVARTARALLGA